VCLLLDIQSISK